MKWRCVKDMFGYCDTEPKWSKKPRWIEIPQGQPQYPVDGECRLNPKTCGHYQVLSEQLQEVTTK